MRISFFIVFWGEFADLGYARSAWTICGSLGVGRTAGHSGDWRRENELGFTLRFDGGKPFPGSAAVWPDGFTQHFVTEISNGRLAGWQAVLREQFSDGTKRSPSLPQLDDDIFGRQQVLELLLVTRRKFRHRFADIVWIKCGHTRIIYGDESSAVRTRCNRDPDIWRIQRGRGLSTNTDWIRSWTVRGCGLDADTDSLRTWTGHGRLRPGQGRGQGLTADAAAGVARTWLRTGHGHGRGTDADWFRTGRGRGLDTATASRPGDGADIPRPNRDHFADSKTCLPAGVRRALS